jgi:hypothetical protein
MTTSPEFATGPRNRRMDFIFLARRGGPAPELSGPFSPFSTAFFLCIWLDLEANCCGENVNKTKSS